MNSGKLIIYCLLHNKESEKCFPSEPHSDKKYVAGWTEYTQTREIQCKNIKRGPPGERTLAQPADREEDTRHIHARDTCNLSRVEVAPVYRDSRYAESRTRISPPCFLAVGLCLSPNAFLVEE